MDSANLLGRLEQIVEKLSGTRLLAGTNISLNQQQEGLTITASAPDVNAKLMRWLLRANDRLGKPEILAGRRILLERGPDSVTISADLPAANAAGKGGGSFDGDFPFKCEIQPDGSLLVQGYNEGAKRYFRNYVTLGLTRLEIAEKSFASLSADTWIYLEVSCSGGSYSAELKSASTLPAQERSKYIVPVAFAKAKDGKLSEAFQMQYGPVEGSGRIF